MVHDVGVSATSVSDVVQRSSLDGYVCGADSDSSWRRCFVYASFKFSYSLLMISSEISPVIEVDIRIPSSSIDTVVRLFSRKLYRTCLHLMFVKSFIELKLLRKDENNQALEIDQYCLMWLKFWGLLMACQRLWRYFMWLEKLHILELKI